MIKEKKVEQTRKSSDSSDVLIPQEVEAIGWDDQEELDYSKIQQQPSSSLRSGLPVLSMMDQPSVEMGDITRQRRPSGNLGRDRRGEGERGDGGGGGGERRRGLFIGLIPSCIVSFI